LDWNLAQALTTGQAYLRQWAGHRVKLMAPQFVKPYIKSNKNDVNDACGIAEAVTRPDMKFVSIKNIEQQDILLLHRSSALVIKQRTAQANQIRGLKIDRYLRTLLIHGARSVVNVCETKTDDKNLWVADKKQRRGYNKAAVALANKNARTIWALLATGAGYRNPAAMKHNLRVLAT